MDLGILHQGHEDPVLIILLYSRRRTGHIYIMSHKSPKGAETQVTVFVIELQDYQPPKDLSL